MKTTIGVNNRKTVGVLISTYNWPEALDLVFQSILKQSRLPDEIIIADDGSSWQTQQIVAEYASKCPVPIKYVWQEDKGFRKSLVLNKAMHQAAADYIIQIDGDIILHKKFVEDHYSYARPGAFVQGARVMITEPVSSMLLRRKKANEFSWTSKGISNRFNALRIPQLSSLMNDRKQQPTNIKACNLAFWRRDFILVNGYNNDFEGWGCEDAEFAARLLNGGIRKRRLKLAAICYHLYHSFNSKHNISRNEEICQATIRDRHSFCRNGYVQVQKNAIIAPFTPSVIEVGLPNPSIAS